MFSFAGSGGFGVAGFRKIKRTDITVGIKYIPADSCENFEREVLYKKPIIHSNVLRIFGQDESIVAGTNLHIVIMEYMYGGNLEQGMYSMSTTHS